MSWFKKEVDRECILCGKLKKLQIRKGYYSYTHQFDCPLAAGWGNDVNEYNGTLDGWICPDRIKKWCKKYKGKIFYNQRK